MCGGTESWRTGRGHWGGLSPRVRGNPAPDRHAKQPAGSIPACAGEPIFSWFISVLRQVYPRVCGGTPVCSARRRPGRGLSPRVRGNPAVSVQSSRGRRSIPACAGEPITAFCASASMKVYPRVCGGTVLSLRIFSCTIGLSPRVRGNLRHRRRRRPHDRSIPACAGEPAWVRADSMMDRVYPRVCGGTAGTLYTELSTRGLSPRVRGNPGTVTGLENP